MNELVQSFTRTFEQVREQWPDADLGPLAQAYTLAARAHDGQNRNSGEPYLSHPLAVAQILADMRMDPDTVATALLHDALEDNPLSKAEMAREVGPVITELVDGVTKIGKLKFRSKAELQAENFRKMMLAMSRDLRVILVKLADRLHNMRTMDGQKAEKRERISRETLDVYVPIANRLGLHSLKAELEARSFPWVAPDDHARIQRWLEGTESDREEYIERTVASLEQLLAENGTAGRVSGRAKAPYSIWKKMVRQGGGPEKVRDLLAFRVIVPELSDCYAVLGWVHASYDLVPDRIKDYISRPKPNGYRSLHTTVIGPEGKRIEVQIRTEAMHRFNEEGVAAHWAYKEGGGEVSQDEVLESVRLKEAVEAATEAGDAADFMETFKLALYAEEVFVFTPAGEVKRFPLGATPLDFAYSVHTEVGNRCQGAIVNGRLRPLDYELRTGETVEIRTGPHQQPRADWLKIAKTHRAQAKIRRELRLREQEAHERLGRKILHEELDRLGWSWDRVIKEGRLPAYFERRNLKEETPIFVEVGRGLLDAADVAKAVLPEGAWVSRHEEAAKNRMQALYKRIVGQSRSPVIIDGEDDLAVAYAGCCSPLPGQKVVGYVSRGRGIIIHAVDCREVEKLEADRVRDVVWDRKSGVRHSVPLAVWCDNKPGILAEIAGVCRQLEVNIESAEAKRDIGEEGLIVLQVAVDDTSALRRVCKALEALPVVNHVERAHG